ncbi:MAG: peptidase, partial [Sphingomonas sp.]
MRFDLGKKAMAALALASALALGGCYDDGYGYGGVSTGYGYGSGLYGGPYAGGYGNAIGPGYGWYDGFYYPGNGYYIYDRGGSRHRWNDNQRRYWEGRRAGLNDGRWNGRRNDGRWNGRPGDGRPGDGRWNGRPGGGRPGDGRWRDRGDRADRPPITRPGAP